MFWTLSLRWLQRSRWRGTADSNANQLNSDYYVLAADAIAALWSHQFVSIALRWQIFSVLFLKCYFHLADFPDSALENIFFVPLICYQSLYVISRVWMRLLRLFLDYFANRLRLLFSVLSFLSYIPLSSRLALLLMPNPAAASHSESIIMSTPLVSYTNILYLNVIRRW